MVTAEKLYDTVWRLTQVVVGVVIFLDVTGHLVEAEKVAVINATLWFPIACALLVAVGYTAIASANYVRYRATNLKLPRSGEWSHVQVEELLWLTALVSLLGMALVAMVPEDGAGNTLLERLVRSSRSVVDTARANFGVIVLVFILLVLRRFRDETAMLVDDIEAAPIPKIVMATSRFESYRALHDVLRDSPYGSKVYVSNFEKLAEPYDTGIADSEREFMRFWDKSVREGRFDVSHVVHVSSERDVEEVRRRVEKFANPRTQYRLSVLVGELDFAPPDIFTIAPDWTVIHLGTRPSEPLLLGDTAIYCRDRRIASAFEGYFQVLLSCGIAVKTHDKVDYGALNSVRALVASRAARELERLYHDFGTSQHDLIIRGIVDREMHSLRQLLSTAASEGRLILAAADVDALREMTASVGSSLLATSYAGSYRFWTSTTGRQMVQLSRRVVAMNDPPPRLERIFIVRDQEELDALSSVMVEQDSIGISVFYVFSDTLHPQLKEDFMVLDKRLLFRQQITKDGEVMGNSLSDEVGAVRAAVDRFESIKRFAVRYRGSAAV